MPGIVGRPDGALTGPGHRIAAAATPVVELVNVDTNVVVARSTSDGVGQVAFPDVPAGRYSVHAKRDGFADVTSPPFTVHAGGTEQVLVEMHLVFIRESVSVVAPANSPTQSASATDFFCLPEEGCGGRARSRNCGRKRPYRRAR